MTGSINVNARVAWLNGAPVSGLSRRQACDSDASQRDSFVA